MQKILIKIWRALCEFLALKKRQFLITGMIVLAVVLILLSVYQLLFSAPANFPVNILISVKKDKPLSEVSAKLKRDGLIRSEVVFNNMVILLGGERRIVAGNYTFEKPLNVYLLAKRIIKGEKGVSAIKIVIPEGLNVFEIEKMLQKKFGNFEPIEYFILAKEGYLFPDTYSFFADTDTSQIIQSMTSNFDRKIKDISQELSGFKKSFDDVITMASILEEEGNNLESKKMIAGILWKRLDIKMPLQVDSSFQYVNGKSTFDLTKSDLKINSPYNTYKNGGLPPTPISNPGMDSILAAVNPSKSSYLYFLSDYGGNMHYSKTYNEHKKNTQIYLAN